MLASSPLRRATGSSGATVFEESPSSCCRSARADGVHADVRWPEFQCGGFYGTVNGMLARTPSAQLLSDDMLEKLLGRSTDGNQTFAQRSLSKRQVPQMISCLGSNSAILNDLVGYARQRSSKCHSLCHFSPARPHRYSMSLEFPFFDATSVHRLRPKPSLRLGCARWHSMLLRQRRASGQFV